jgi:hypothetical protein
MTPSEKIFSARRENGYLKALGAAAVAGAALCTYLAVWGSKYGLDLRVYRDSATAFVHGRNPYLLTFTQIHLASTYPPFALAVLTSLAWASFAVSQWLLWVVSIAATTSAVAIVLMDRGFSGGGSLWFGSFAWTCAGMIALEPARSGIDYGQIEFVLMFLVVADLLVIRPPFRGIAIGVAAAVKLTPLIFILVLVVRRDRSSVARAALPDVLAARRDPARKGWRRCLRRESIVVCHSPPPTIPPHRFSAGLACCVVGHSSSRHLRRLEVRGHRATILGHHCNRICRSTGQPDFVDPSLDLGAAPSTHADRSTAT